MTDKEKVARMGNIEVQIHDVMKEALDKEAEDGFVWCSSYIKMLQLACYYINFIKEDCNVVKYIYKMLEADGYGEILLPNDISNNVAK